MSRNAFSSGCRRSWLASATLVGWAHGQASQRVTLAGSMALALALGVPGCSKPDKPSETEAVQSAAERTRVPPVRRVACKEPAAGGHFLIGEVGRPPVDDGEQEAEALDLPFAVEVGSAVSTRDGFAVALLKADRAVLALLAREGGPGRLVELARVYGDVEPPKLASRDEHLVAAIVGNDAGSQTLTLARIATGSETAEVSLGSVVSQGRDASSAFDLALGNERGVLVWDRWDKARGHGGIEAVGFDPKSLEVLGEPSMLSAAGDDAEMPRVLLRPGGFWLFWVSHGAPEAPGKPAATGQPALTGKPAPGLPSAIGAQDDADAALDSVIDQTPRRLKAMRLDHAARPVGEPISLTAPEAHVLGYDALPFGSGVLVAWRDDPTVLGGEAPEVHLATLGADGTLNTQVIQDDEIAAGTPRLFHDRAGEPGAQYWLALMGTGGAPRLGHFGETGKLVQPLHTASRLAFMEPLALEGSRLLLGRPSGRALDLSVVHCALEAVAREAAPR